MKFRFVLKFACILTVVMLLCQCQKISSNHSAQPTSATPFTMQAEAYLAMAHNKAGAERQGILLLAAGRFIFDGQLQKGADVLANVTPETLSQSDIKNMLYAKIALTRVQPSEALNRLSQVRELNSLSSFYQAQYHEMLAVAFQMQGKTTESFLQRVKLEHVLVDEGQKANNRRLIWLTLTKISTPDLNVLSAEVKPHSEVDGWIQLALIPRQYGDNGEALYDALIAWMHHHPNHPAELMLPKPLEKVKTELFAPPRKIALLLPLSGALAGPGQAIRDGFVEAVSQSPRKQEIDVRLYDTNQTNVVNLYQKAIDEGAQFVVGPLTKNDVNQIATRAHPVPTLLLNETDAKVAPNAYEFGLSPKNEAKQVAATARKRGLTHSLIIAPVGQWGDEVVQAFVSQFQKNGGDVVDIYRFAPQDNLQQGIKNLLQASDAKITKDSKPVGLRRRDDFDMIFLVAYPSKARQIMPTLRYYYAGNIPVYATSSVYGGNIDTQQDRDLDGLQFCDMPWVFTHQMGNRHWPEQLNSYNRLYAMGMDSFALTTKLNQLIIFPAMGVSEQSGMLYLGQNQQISRVLVWGQFRQGVVQEFRDIR